MKDRLKKRTIGDFITARVGELAVDDVGFWQIAPFGRDECGLTDAELDSFVR